MRRRTVRTALVTVGLAYCGVVVVGSPATAGTVSISRTSVISGESVTISGTFHQKVVRPVQLQRKVGASWITVEKATTTSSGVFTFSVKPTGTVGRTNSYRVRAPKVTIAGTTLGVATTAVPSVTLVEQTAILLAPPSVATGSPFTATATLRPVRTGRVSVLQRLVNGAWVEVDRGAQDSAGRTPFAVTFSTSGVQTLRVVAATSADAPPVGSTGRVVSVVPASLQHDRVNDRGA